MRPTEQRFFSTGIRNLDAIMGGGIVEEDVLLLIGPPGSGKTTLVFQIAVAAATAGRSVVYVSTLSEPANRLLKHLRTFSFWKESIIGEGLVFESVDLIVRRSMEVLVEAIVATVRANKAALLIIDGLMTIRDLNPETLAVRAFVNELGTALGPLGCTAILTSSEVPERGQTPPEYTMCDGIIELGQQDLGTQTIRTLRAWKLRGAPHALGSHTVRIGRGGVSVFPRAETSAAPTVTSYKRERCPTDAGELDNLLAGGLARGSATIVAGGPGTGKTILGLQYAAAGARRGERCVFFSFRESEHQLLELAHGLGIELERHLREGAIVLVRRPPVDLQIDELVSLLWATADVADARRLVIDSLDDVESAIGDPRRRAAVMAVITEGIRARGVAALLTREVDTFATYGAGEPRLPMLAENIVHLRFDGSSARVLSLVKSTGIGSIQEHRYDVGPGGLTVRVRPALGGRV